MLGTPTPQMLQERVDTDLNEDRNRFETYMNTYFTEAKSPSDRSSDA